MANLTEKKEIVLFDSMRDIEMDEIKDYCESNDREVPEENSTEYWDIVNHLREWEADDFRDNCSGMKLDLGQCLVHGYAGLWNGPSEGGILKTINGPSDLLEIAENCDEVKVVIDPDEGLTVKGYHHDGTNTYHVYQLTDRGNAYVDKNSLFMDRRTLHHKLLGTKGMLKKVRKVF